MKKFFSLLLLAGALLIAPPPSTAQVSIGIRIGPPPPPRVVLLRPVDPGPDYLWVDGYWYPVNDHYEWHPGYWTLPPYPGAYWVAPRHDRDRYYRGYWDGPRGRFDHDHHWDHDRRRDYDRDHDHGHGHRHHGHD